jgi:hypothetical protein
MIKNLHFLLILGPKHDISKRHLKRRILTWFLRSFWLEITSKKFKSNIFRPYHHTGMLFLKNKKYG